MSEAGLGTRYFAIGWGGSATSHSDFNGSLEIRDVTVIDGSEEPAFGPTDVFVKSKRIVRVVVERKTNAETQSAQRRAETWGTRSRQAVATALGRSASTPRQPT